jgi:F-type H+-transporting ATPase subunit a
LPQSGQSITQGKSGYIIVAQAGGEGTATAGEAPGQTHAGVEHEEAENPVKEYPAGYFSFTGLLAGIILIAICIFATRNLTKKTPSKKQALIEQAVASINHFCRNAIGPGGEKYAPLAGTLFAFILVSNLMGVLPFVVNPRGHGVASLTPAPTSNLSVTFALAIIVFIYSVYVGIRTNGLGFFKHMAGPIPWLAWLIFPIELIGLLVRPLSLSMRLFGNIFGEETVTAVLIALSMSVAAAIGVPWLPIPLQIPMLMFGVFGSIVQAGVFTILTCSYIALSIGDHGDEHGHGHEHGEAHGQGGPEAGVAIQAPI